MTDDRLSLLYRTYGPVIFARCRRLLRDDAAAEDATQETFLRVQRHLDDVPDASQALAWIYRVATNYCLNEVRDRKRQAEPVSELPERASEHLEETLGDRDLAVRLIDRAPEKLRVVAYLRYVDELDQAEIARMLDVSTRTVINRLAEFEKNAAKFTRRATG